MRKRQYIMMKKGQCEEARKRDEEGTTGKGGKKGWGYTVGEMDEEMTKE
jgi:hypothetical protein